MKRSWMGVITAGAILSSGCATIAGGAVDLSGARSGPAMRPGGAGPGAPLKLGGARPGTGDAMAFRRGPVHAIDGEHYHSLADPETWKPSPVSLAWNARQPPWLGPDESPLIENGIFAWGVKGLPGADIRRLGLGAYAKSWAESGLGRSFAEVSHDPSTIYTYVHFRVFPGGGESRLLLY